MKQLLKSIFSSKTMLNLLLNICLHSVEAIKNFFGYLFIKQKNIRQKNIETKIEEYNKLVENVVDNGNLDDLLNIRKNK